MRGHITRQTRKDKDGNIIWQSPHYSLVLELEPDPVTGKRKQQWVTVKGNKKAADTRLAELLNKVNTGDYIKPGKTTLGEFLTRWLDEYAKPNLSPRTVEGYEQIIRCHLKPKLGSIALVALKPQQVQAYYTEMLKAVRCGDKSPLTARTVRHHHMLLHKALNSAMKWGLISRNAADAVDIPKAKRIEMQVMDEEQINAFLKAAKDTEYYGLFYIALFTGMRRSELLALRWQDIDLTLGQISVCRSLHQLRDKSIIYREPKTSHSRRTIALPPSTISVLREHRGNQEIDGALTGRVLNDDSLVFSHYDGKPLLPGSITQAWRRLTIKTGIHKIRLHDARHTHATLLLKQNVSPKVVQERLGHSTIAVTMDTYSHIMPGMQEAAANKFDDIFLQKSKKLEDLVQRSIQ